MIDNFDLLYSRLIIEVGDVQRAYLLTKIENLSRKNKYCFASKDTLAQMIGRGKTWTKASLKFLETNG